jgi:thymidylate synthase
VPIIEEMLRRPTYPAPRFHLNPQVKDFYDFTPDDAVLEQYESNPQIKGIPVAV